MRLSLAVPALVIVIGCARSEPPVVTLAPLPSVGSSGHSGTELAARADACFADPTCALATASRDFVLADDAGAVPLACLRFYYGTGVPRDLVRARRCLARTTVAMCDGSPDLDRLYLASMEVAGQGGPVDRAAAQALLAPCFADVSVQGVLDAKPTPDFDFCRDVGGTTLAMTECTTVSMDRANFALARWRKAIEPKLGPTGTAREKLARADAAFTAFSLADAARAGDAFRGGSLENLTYAGQRVTLLEARVARFEGAFAGPPPVDLARATSSLRTTLASARTELDAEGAKLFTAATSAFETYVDAEVALWVELGANADAVRARLLWDRVKEFR